MDAARADVGFTAIKAESLGADLARALATYLRGDSARDVALILHPRSIPPIEYVVIDLARTRIGPEPITLEPLCGVQ